MNAVRVVGAAICLLVGLVWIGQGTSLIGGSSMTGNRVWSLVGLVLVLVAAWQLFALLRAARRRP
ncbi:MAG TPA: hypothetical protein VF157_05850 [Chloroflexota bacterium]